MKRKLMPLFLILTSITILSISCKKPDQPSCLQVKVIRSTCASLVIQVLNNDTIGEDGWTDTFMNKNARYDNVFTASNACKISAAYKSGDIFYITIGSPASNDCVQCALYDAPPGVVYEVKTISNQPCGMSVH